MKAQILLIILFSFSSIFYIGNNKELNKKTKTITGVVTNLDEEPVHLASVCVKNNFENIVFTNKKGEYSINVNEEDKYLVFSSIGLSSVEVEIKKSNVIDVSFTEMEISEEVFIFDHVKGEIVEEPLYYMDSEESYSSDDEGALGGSTRGFGTKKSAPKVASAKGSTIIVDYVDGYTTTDLSSKKETKSKTKRDRTKKDKSRKDKADKKESGQLTAGEINDFSKWNLWQDITGNELKMYKDMWGFYPLQRYSVLITDQETKPVINCKVQLQTKKGEVIWSSITDNTGKAELWTDMFDSTTTKTDDLMISINYYGDIHSIDKPTSFQKGLNKYVINTACNIPDAVDIAFVVDATGSMGDELLYLQAEIEDVIKKTQKRHKNLDISLGSVFYRDHNEEYLTVKSDFNSKIKKAVEFINEQTAQAGGDFPEAVEDGLEVAINELEWREEARARVVFLVLDAPPHNTQEAVDRLQKISQIASEKGIRIVPITCSGIDKGTEYLMRSLALATNGTYVFLTDDSGIGDSHIKPTTDKFDVELFNELLIRLLDQYVTTPDCKNRIDFEEDLISDTTFVVTPTSIISDTNQVSNSDSLNNKTDVEQYNYNEGIKYYPNPTTGPVNIEIKGEIKELYIADYSGKILERREIYDKEKVVLDIEYYPAGMYFIKYLNKDKWMTGKIILLH